MTANQDGRQDRPTTVAIADHPNAAVRATNRIRVDPDSINVMDRFIRPPR